jgi:hypothetical protein
MDSITSPLKFKSHKLRQFLTRFTIFVYKLIVNYLKPEREIYPQSHLESIESAHVLPISKYQYFG